MRHGYTLVELILACVIISIVVGITTPYAWQTRDRFAVEEAARKIVVAHRYARITAILRNCATVLTVNADSITIRCRSDTTRLWRETGPATSGVALAGPERTVTFSPIGLAAGVSNATYTLTRGEARRSVIVSRLGRVRVAS